jgi:hypothetical protein
VLDADPRNCTPATSTTDKHQSQSASVTRPLSATASYAGKIARAYAFALVTDDYPPFRLAP